MSNVLVIGSLNADLVVKSPRFPQPGETISGDDLQIIPGARARIKLWRRQGKG